MAAQVGGRGHQPWTWCSLRPALTRSVKWATVLSAAFLGWHVAATWLWHFMQARGHLAFGVPGPFPAVVVHAELGGQDRPSAQQAGT